MIRCYYLVTCIICVQAMLTRSQEVDIISVLDYNFMPINDIQADVYALENNRREQEKVTIQVYYECLCPDCRRFDTQQLRPLFQKISQYLDIYLYPYGNAKTTIHDGHYEFECQHGPEECYGNKLHACAIDLQRNTSVSVIYNTCMMDYSQTGHGSDDAAADVCGKLMRIDSAPIKKCAKSDRGTQLLKYYGDVSKMVNFKYVPFILINGVPNNGGNFMKDVCAAFKHPPPQCLH